MKYLVILNGGSGRPMFLTDNNDEACLFDSKRDAENSGNDNACGEARGFDVVEWDYFEDKISAKIDQLKKELEELEELKKAKKGHVPGYYQPNIGERYFFSTEEAILTRFWGGGKHDIWLIDNGLCFKTIEEAEKVREYKKAKLSLVQRIHKYNDGWKQDWYNSNIDKYCFTIDASPTEIIKIMRYRWEQNLESCMYFKSYEIGKKIIEDLGEATIKLAIRGVEL